ncbi:GNAT family N-acetyltransferase [Micromonospora sp. NPDC005194]|uniref:GNAT family N-acetyltransferase n=1 Tax=Micromonospora sp. NPDC005194 TaxID=3156870 RepID=UPI0033B7A162
MLQLVRGTTAAFSSINLGILFGVVIIPFPTAVLASALADGNTDDLRVAVVLYAFAAALMSAPWWVLFAYVRRHPELRADSVDQEQVRVQEARPIVGLVLYGLTGVLGWLVTPLLGLIGVVVMIIFHGATSQGLRHGDGLFGSLMGGAVLDAERIDGYLYEEAGEHLGTGLGMRTRGVVGVFNIAVVPGARGRGLGRAITEKVLREGVAAGADAAYLQTSALGRPLYESMGFRLLENWTAFHA